MEQLVARYAHNVEVVDSNSTPVRIKSRAPPRWLYLGNAKTLHNLDNAVLHDSLRTKDHIFQPHDLDPHLCNL